VALDLVGTGYSMHEASLRRTAVQEGVADLVTLCGYQTDRGSLFSGYDVSLVCSRAEAFGRVTVEAMKCGIPVIGARAAATAELISDHHTGLLYEPGNASDLANAIEALIGDEELRFRLAEAGRLWANETFTRTRFAHEFLAVVEEALA
jgi:glycosyltransferase involved in cell wall biosynthesis